MAQPKLDRVVREVRLRIIAKIPPLETPKGPESMVWLGSITFVDVPMLTKLGNLWTQMRSNDNLSVFFRWKNRGAPPGPVPSFRLCEEYKILVSTCLFLSFRRTRRFEDLCIVIPFRNNEEFAMGPALKYFYIVSGIWSPYSVFRDRRNRYQGW